MGIPLKEKLSMVAVVRNVVENGSWDLTGQEQMKTHHLRFHGQRFSNDGAQTTWVTPQAPRAGWLCAAAV